MIERSTRVALITGASRRGAIGAAICRALAAGGFDVAFTHWRAYDRDTGSGLDQDGPTVIQREIEAFGRRSLAIEADLSDPSVIGRLLDEIQAKLGELFVVVNNACFSKSAGIDVLDAKTLDDHYAVNLRATMLLTVEFARRWRGGTGGRVISLTSGQSLGPMPDELPYVATKGAIEAFTLSASPTLARRGIMINAVDPGATDSGWMADELKAEVRRVSPLGRIGQPEDIARLIAFLASDAAGWITGQVIHSRGGL